MDGNTYVGAAVRPWNDQAFGEVLAGIPGNWVPVTMKGALPFWVEKLKPRYAFFPDWQWKVPRAVLEATECVCFHETDVPYGRGGSPVQNLIVRGRTETVVAALRMEDELDAGPVYMRRPLSLHGLAEEVYLRAARTVAEMIQEIAEAEPEPVPQSGFVTAFRRRTPDQSNLALVELAFSNAAREAPSDALLALHDFVRMLDAEGYPQAFLDLGPFRFEFSRPALRTGRVVADVTVRVREER